MTAQEVIQVLADYGNEGTKRIYISHGASEPLFGVKIGDMKKLLKKVGKQYNLAKELYETGNADARYFAALCADETRMTKADMRKWARQADWHMLSEYAVAQLISETRQGWDLGMEFITAKKERLVCCGWAVLGSWLSFRPTEEIEVDQVEDLLQTIEKTVRDQPNRLRFSMFNFVVAAGAFVPEVTEECLAIGERLNDVEVEPVKKGCSIPEIVKDISKIQKMGRIGKKRKAGRC